MSETLGPPARRRISRRRFLIVAGAAGAGLIVGIGLVGVPYGRLRLATYLDAAAGPPGTVKAVPTAWLQILPDNSIKLFIPKVEMGQGIHTALAQIIADELEAAWDQIAVISAATGQGVDDPIGTNASNSVSSLYQILREAGATVRGMLVSAASAQLGRPEGELAAKDGFVVATTGVSASRSYGEIVANASSWAIPEGAAALKAEADFKFIGEPMPRVDLPAKITGQALYGSDVRVEGLLHGAVAHSPTISGKLRSAAPGTAAAVPGVAKVVIEDDFAGVVAASREQAYRGLAAMELEWDPGRAWQQEEIEAMVQAGKGNGVVIQDDGNAPGSLRSSTSVIDAEYRTPMAYHAHMEPQAATADVRADSVSIWAPTQAAVSLRGAVAEALKREEGTVTVYTTYLGGGFGRKIQTTPAIEAARLSAASGRPVKILYSRPEDFANGFVRPPTHSRLRAALRPDGRIETIEHLQASGEVAFPFLPGIAATVMGADFAAWRGAMIRYAAPNRRTEAFLPDLPVATGWWRGLGLFPNAFAIESFMDELALAAGLDPIDFRLRNLPDDDLGARMRACLAAVAELSAWASPPPGGRGRGVALVADVGTVVAEVAEVSVEGGEIRVHKVSAAVDPGRIINPDGARAQVQGAITMGVSATLLEQVEVVDGVLTPGNFGAYPLLTMAKAPEIASVLLQGEGNPHGLGEPPIGPVPAAVANAVFALTGQRLRRLPLRLAG